MKSLIRIMLKQSPRMINMMGPPVIKLSKWQSSNFFLLRWFASGLMFLPHILLGDDYYKFLIHAQKQAKKSIFKRKNSPLKFKQYCSRILAGDPSTTVQKYLELLDATDIPAEQQDIWSSRFMEVGRLDLSLASFQNLIETKNDQLSGAQRLNVLRQLGAVCFMSGKNKEANYYWRLAGQIRRSLFKPTTPKSYRILGSAWFAAIGHVAMLDYYLKYKRLHYGEQRIVMQWDVHSIPGEELFYRLQEMGIVVLKMDDLEKDYDKWAKKNDHLSWKQLSTDEHAALIDDFWEYDFPDGEILGYAHAAARIQQEWEQAAHPPLFQITDLEKSWLQKCLANLGVPKNAWYVCLHVRESGFHKQWNSFYPSMRDANLDDYYEAIQTIVNAGGWVIRMGDASMKPLRPMPNVIDYAHSLCKTPVADILLAAGCRFFLGTNSGFATVSVIYGRPCALSNWVPIGWPLWPSQDLMIPKLFRDKLSKRYLSLEEIFSRGLAFMQNWSDLPNDIELVANTAEEIANLTAEMLRQTANDKKQKLGKNSETSLVQARYGQLAKQYEGFIGSRIDSAFIEAHSDVFLNVKMDLDDTEDDTAWHEQLSDNTTVTSN